MADGGGAPAPSRRFTYGRDQRPQHAANGDKDAHDCDVAGFDLPQHRNRIGDINRRAGTCIGCRPVANAVRAVQYLSCLARESHLRCDLPAGAVVIEMLHTPAGIKDRQGGGAGLAVAPMARGNYGPPISASLRRPVQPEARGMGGLLQLPPAPRRTRRPNPVRKTATKDPGPTCHRPTSVTQLSPEPAR